MWKKDKLIYLASMIDGEGTFYISPNPNYRSRIVIVNTDERIIRWLLNNFGGLVYSRTDKKHPHWKLKYEWIVSKCDMAQLCKALLPHLVSKKEQAETMIKLRNSYTRSKGNGTKHINSKDLLDFREECYQNMKKFNHRIPLPL